MPSHDGERYDFLHVLLYDEHGYGESWHVPYGEHADDGSFPMLYGENGRGETQNAMPYDWHVLLPSVLLIY